MCVWARLHGKCRQEPQEATGLDQHHSHQPEKETDTFLTSIKHLRRWINTCRCMFVFTPGGCVPPPTQTLQNAMVTSRSEESSSSVCVQSKLQDHIFHPNVEQILINARFPPKHEDLVSQELVTNFPSFFYYIHRTKATATRCH